LPTRACRGLNSGELPAGSGRRRCHDDDQLVERNSMVMTTGSIVSRRAGGERPEEARRRRASGARFPASQNQLKASGDAPGYGKDNGTG
jgi:hypothetical protein